MAGSVLKREILRPALEIEKASLPAPDFRVILNTSKCLTV